MRNVTGNTTTVGQLVEFLKTQPKNLPVAYRCCSEYDSLSVDQIEVMKLQPARPDGWVHSTWDDDDLRTVEYLVFPGN